jgi:uncharacterized protein (DUF697 family)
MRQGAHRQGGGGEPDVADAAGSPSAVALRCRSMLRRRALAAAAVSVVPIPGLGIALDVALMSKIVDDINREFGLTPQQIAALAPRRRQKVYDLLQKSGNLLIGQIVTAQAVIRLLAAVGVRVNAKRAARFVPIVGQAASAALGYWIAMRLGNRHIDECLRIARQLALPAPAGEVEDVAFVDVR